MSKSKELTPDILDKLLSNEFSYTGEPVDDIIDTTTSSKVVKPSTKKITVQYDETINFEGRGFATLEDAIQFVNTDTFKKLGTADKDEYLMWLKK